MGKFNFSDEFKREAVAQIVERGYSTAGGPSSWPSGWLVAHPNYEGGRHALVTWQRCERTPD